MEAITNGGTAFVFRWAYNTIFNGNMCTYPAVSKNLVSCGHGRTVPNHWNNPIAQGKHSAAHRDASQRKIATLQNHHGQLQSREEEKSDLAAEQAGSLKQRGAVDRRLHWQGIQDVLPT